MNYEKINMAIVNDEKIPRKSKKKFLGKLLSKKEISKKLKIISDSESCASVLFEEGKMESLFCPKCGCEESYTRNYSVDYPEVWNESFCCRCNNKVSEQDNSPAFHALDLDGFAFFV